MKIKGGGGIKRWRIVVAPAGVKFFFSGSYRIQVISVCVCVDTHTEGRGCERFDLRVYEIKKRFEGGEKEN